MYASRLVSWHHRVSGFRFVTACSTNTAQRLIEYMTSFSNKPQKEQLPTARIQLPPSHIGWAQPSCEVFVSAGVRSAARREWAKRPGKASAGGNSGRGSFGERALLCKAWLILSPCLSPEPLSKRPAMTDLRARDLVAMCAIVAVRPDRDMAVTQHVHDVCGRRMPGLSAAVALAS
jgi:hypothetical protein